MIAYVPFLTLLLPERLGELAGGARIGWLATITLAGAITASVANVAFGWASDVAGTRRGWAGAGLALTLASYAGLALAATPAAIAAAVVGYQAALNMLLAALTAWMADAVPERRRGLLGGLIGAAQPTGYVAGVIVTAAVLPSHGARLATVCVLVAATTLPLLLWRVPAYGVRPSDSATVRLRRSRRDFALLWTARLLVQIAGSTLFAFLFFLFQSLPSPPPIAAVARLSAGAAILAFPLALALGVLSDRSGRRGPALVAVALAGATGLFVMAQGRTVGAVMAGYAVFGSASAAFLALHAGYAMALLPSRRRRGRDLGVLNLANTLPSVIAPLLTVGLVPAYGFPLLLHLLAASALLAAGCILLVERGRRKGKRAANRDR